MSFALWSRVDSNTALAQRAVPCKSVSLVGICFLQTSALDVEREQRTGHHDHLATGFVLGKEMAFFRNSWFDLTFGRQLPWSFATVKDF